MKILKGGFSISTTLIILISIILVLVGISIIIKIADNFKKSENKSTSYGVDQIKNMNKTSLNCPDYWRYGGEDGEYSICNKTDFNSIDYKDFSTKPIKFCKSKSINFQSDCYPYNDNSSDNNNEDSSYNEIKYCPDNYSYPVRICDSSSCSSFLSNGLLCSDISNNGKNSYDLSLNDYSKPITNDNIISLIDTGLTANFVQCGDNYYSSNNIKYYIDNPDEDYNDIQNCQYYDEAKANKKDTCPQTHPHYVLLNNGSSNLCSNKYIGYDSKKIDSAELQSIIDKDRNNFTPCNGNANLTDYKILEYDSKNDCSNAKVCTGDIMFSSNDKCCNRDENNIDYDSICGNDEYENIDWYNAPGYQSSRTSNITDGKTLKFVTMDGKYWSDLLTKAIKEKKMSIITDDAKVKQRCDWLKSNLNTVWQGFSEFC